jgi:hypothetical protein
VLLPLASCSKKEIDKENVIQIGEVGLRKGVFERRFKLSSEYGKNKEFSPEILKSFINRILLPEYLFIQKSFDLGFQNDPFILKTVFEFKMNALASNNAIHSKEMFISDKELADFYNDKKYLYSFEIIQHTAFNEADSIKKILSEGKKLKFEKETMPDVFPRKIEYVNKSFGESVPFEIYKQLDEMKEGEISEPIYSAPLWIVIKLTDKVKYQKTNSLEESKTILLKDLQGIKKIKETKLYVDSLKSKYNLEILNKDYSKIIKAFVINNEQVGFFNRANYSGSIEDIVIKTSLQNINVDMFFFIFNRTNRFSKIKKLVYEDVDVFMNDLATQLVLYLDALEQGVDKYPTLSEQIENKLYRVLYSKYLKEEISDKVSISQEVALSYYNDNRGVWKGEFEKVKSSIINKMRKEAMYKYRDQLVKDLSDEFDVLYNELLLQEIADSFTAEKKNKSE